MTFQPHILCRMSQCTLLLWSEQWVQCTVVVRGRVVHGWGNTGTILGQYRHNTGKIQAQYWQNTGTILGQYWHNTWTILAQYWDNTGTILAKYRPNTGTILAQYGHNTGTILAHQCRLAGFTCPPAPTPQGHLRTNMHQVISICIFIYPLKQCCSLGSRGNSWPFYYIFSHLYCFLEDPAKASGCSTNIVVLYSLIWSPFSSPGFPPQSRPNR